MLHHIGLQVKDKQEIETFYKKVLGFKEQYAFNIPKELSMEIFGIDKETPIFKLEKNDLLLEIFVHEEIEDSSYAHLCIEIEDWDTLIKNLNKFDYVYKLKKKPNKKDMLFIFDHSGNIFEIK